MDIEPVQPLGSTPWTKIVRRHSREEDAQGRRHGAAEDEQAEEEPLEEDDEGNPHIDVRV
jgi:hypothetical protein